MSTVAVEFDPFSDDYFNDPTEVYRRLRDEAPVYHNEHYGFYALSRFEDLVQVTATGRASPAPTASTCPRSGRTRRPSAASA